MFKLTLGMSTFPCKGSCYMATLLIFVSKAPSLYFCQFNGKSGCSICLHPGKRIQQGKESIQIYPYSIEQPPKWTHAQTLLQAQVAERTGKAVFGVKIL